MMRLLTVIVFLAATQLSAQREYGVCDSTFYKISDDTTIVAGKNNLYFITQNGIEKFAHFPSGETSEYIRDFDAVSPELWYTLIGSRYIGFDSFLYKSTDRGQNWVQDSSFYTATNYGPQALNYYNSVNSLQHIGKDTIVLFVGYYESGIVYSTDGGETWNEWFRQMQAHYFGMFECSDKYYIYGFQGDGFSAWMFGFDRDLIFTSNENGDWDMLSGKYHPQCTGQQNPECIYSQNTQSNCEHYEFFKNYIDDNCSSGITAESTQDRELKIEVDSEKIIVSGNFGNSSRNAGQFRIYGITGCEYKTGHLRQFPGFIEMDINYLQPGFYILKTPAGIGKFIKAGF
jgi:hypothetical protein